MLRHKKGTVSEWQIALRAMHFNNMLTVEQKMSLEQTATQTALPGTSEDALTTALLGIATAELKGLTVGNAFEIPFANGQQLYAAATNLLANAELYNTVSKMAHKSIEGHDKSAGSGRPGSEGR